MQRIGKELSLPSHHMALTGLLHDIGKILDDSWGNTHAQAGASFLQSHGIPQAITSAILSHHDEAAKQTPESIILAVADRISGGCLAARTKTAKRDTILPPHTS